MATNPRRKVIRVEEEWRTKPRGWVRNLRGRACLWIGLECGHFVQRMRPIQADGTWVAPTYVRCDDCGAGDPPRRALEG